jgi:uncharacterized SAM-binding protein YcdF (DUF218 family)
VILWPARLLWRVVVVSVLVVFALLVYFGVTAVQVWLTSRQYDARAAQAIVVMGAAQWDGVPSPDLRARLEEALALYQHGYAPLIMVTGAKQTGDKFTESEASAKWLEFHGVPAHAIMEVGGDDSWQNLADAAPELQRQGITKVLVVTDPFHEDRSMAIATDVGLTPYPTPTRTSPISGWSTLPYFAKETLGVGLGRIIGFSHLHALG